MKHVPDNRILTVFTGKKNPKKITCMDILSLAAEQVAQSAEDLIGRNASNLC